MGDLHLIRRGRKKRKEVEISGPFLRSEKGHTGGDSGNWMGWPIWEKIGGKTFGIQQIEKASDAEINVP